MTERSDHLEMVFAVALLVGVLVLFFIAKPLLTARR